MISFQNAGPLAQGTRITPRPVTFQGVDTTTGVDEAIRQLCMLQAVTGAAADVIEPAIARATQRVIQVYGSLENASPVDPMVGELHDLMEHDRIFISGFRASPSIPNAPVVRMTQADRVAFDNARDVVVDAIRARAGLSMDAAIARLTAQGAYPDPMTGTLREVSAQICRLVDVYCGRRQRFRSNSKRLAIALAAAGILSVWLLFKK